MVNNAEMVILDNFAPQQNMYNQLATPSGPIGQWQPQQASVQPEFNPHMFFKQSLGNMNKNQMSSGRSNLGGISMSAGPRISGDVSMSAAVNDDHMDEEMAKLSNKLGIDDLGEKIKGKKVLMRVDFNVPIQEGKVTDPKRISATIPSIKYLKDQGAAAIILMSHCGRPDGNVIPKFSLEQVVSTLEKELGGSESVTFVGDCIGEDVDKAIANAKDGEIILLDNLRFYAEETGSGKKDGEKFKPSEKEVEFFRGELSKHGDIYVNDAFGTAHRAHSSMVGVDVPTKAAGFLMKKELDYFGKVLENPVRPLSVVMGGAKVKDKIQLIYNMLDVVDEMIIGGGMAFTFDKVLNGTEIGGSLYDEEGAEIVKDIMKKAEEKGVTIHIPTDYMCADKFAADAATEVKTSKDGIKEGWMGLDIGPDTIKANSEVIKRSNTVFWNGP